MAEQPVLIAPPTPGNETSEHSLTKWGMGIATVCAILPTVCDTIFQAKIEGKGWLAAIAGGILVAVASYNMSRGKVKAAHENAKADAFSTLASMTPEERARALESLTAA